MAAGRRDPSSGNDNVDRSSNNNPGDRTMTSAKTMTSVNLEQIGKRFGDTVALQGVDLEIKAGELFFLLGPSGCGKSTLLRIVAGLLAPTSGKISFNDRDVTALGTEKRNAVMCFQSYALWPHLTVEENVRFGLAVRGGDCAEQRRRVGEVLSLVQMTPYARRKPNELSGGQQQRVALARALAVKPDCLLLDEPLSNLDASLRHEMRSEIRRICKDGGFTTIYVTHDQKEALSVADRLAVLTEGRVAQVGTPEELYYRPDSSFVASFIGQTNLLKATVVERIGATVRVKTQLGVFTASGAAPAEEMTVSIRPEQMRLKRGTEGGDNRIAGKVVETTFLGDSSEHVVERNGHRLRVVSSPPMFHMNGEVVVEVRREDVVMLRE
jgi:iron(III) transport system ATP-binding protein